VRPVREEVTAIVTAILGWSDEAGSYQMECGSGKEKWTTRRLREERNLNRTHQPFQFGERMRVLAGILVSVTERLNACLAKVDHMESVGGKKAQREE